MGAFAILYTFYRLPDMPAKGLILLASPGNVKDYVDQYKIMLGLGQRAYNLLMRHFNALYKVNIYDFVALKFKKNISLPALIIHVRLQEQWPESKLIITEGLGHKLRSPKVVSAVIHFMNEIGG